MKEINIDSLNAFELMMLLKRIVDSSEIYVSVDGEKRFVSSSFIDFYYGTIIIQA